MFSTMQRKLYFYIHFGFLAIFHDFTVTLMPSQGGHFWRLTSLSLSSFPIEPLFFTTWWNERIPGHSEINEVQKSCVNVGLCCFHGNKNYFLGGLYYQKKKNGTKVIYWSMLYTTIHIPNWVLIQVCSTCPLFLPWPPLPLSLACTFKSLQQHCLIVLQTQPHTLSQAPFM